MKIYEKGEKVLHEKAKEVPVREIKTEKIQNIIKKMEQTIAENDDALAVAAPQIGENLRIFAISEWVFNPVEISEDGKEGKKKSDYKNMIFINPEIIKTSKNKKEFPEGCLSVPGVFGTVKRAEKVKVKAYGKEGKKFSRGASGLFAQAIQHELDHLDGILFVDKK